MSAVIDDQGERVGQEEAGKVPEQHTAEVSGVAVAASSEAAEQRVLGDLEGAPTWREVRLAVTLILIAALVAMTARASYSMQFALVPKPGSTVFCD